MLIAVIGIICEYNPPHKGHAYQLAEIRRRFPDSTILCVMSGSFTQRGTPAIVSKYARARTAVRLGADVVVELPPNYAVSCAERFALGGVRLLLALGADTLCFGTEGNVTERLAAAADRLDSPLFSAALEDARKQTAQLGFPALREQVYAVLYGAEEALLLQTPNNILGIAYLRALRASGGEMRVVGIPRIGAEHDAPLLSDAEIASATAIRDCFYRGDDARARSLLPPESAEMLGRETASGRLVRHPDAVLGALLLHWYRTASPKQLSRFAELSGGTAERLCSAAEQAADLSSFLSDASAKNHTSAFIRRAALAGFFGFTDAMQCAPPVYSQLLAKSDREAASVFLRGYRARCSEHDGIPLPALITRPAAYKQYNAAIREAFHLTLSVDAVWGMLTETPIPQAEWFRMGIGIQNPKTNDADTP